MLLLGSTRREEDSKREITVIVACIVEEDGEVIMDLEQTDVQDTPVSHCMPLVVTNAPKALKVSG